MTSRTIRNICLGLLVLMGGRSVASAQDEKQHTEKLDTSLPALLQRLGAYVEDYEKKLAAVVSEEMYLQEVAAQGGVGAQKQVLRSDLLLTKAGDAGWVAFRDVFEVDGEPVRDRDDRLAKLFLNPTGDTREQVQRIVESSARLNLGWVTRNINVPTMVLQLAKPSEQDRSEFRKGGTLDIGDIEAREIRFQERATPRLIQTPSGSAANGRFWIDEATGRVLRTELKLTAGSTAATITVGYSYKKDLDMWLPEIMNERYATPRQPLITGRATYQNFRRFDVEVATIIK